MTPLPSFRYLKASRNGSSRSGGCVATGEICMSATTTRAASLPGDVRLLCSRRRGHGEGHGADNHHVWRTPSAWRARRSPSDMEPCGGAPAGSSSSSSCLRLLAATEGWGRVHPLRLFGAGWTVASWIRDVPPHSSSFPSSS
jgi:hypothetical protein